MMPSSANFYVKFPIVVKDIRDIYVGFYILHYETLWQYNMFQ